MFDFFSAGHDEPVYLINFIPRVLLFGFPLTLELGIVFLIMGLILYFLRRKIAGNFGRKLLILLAVFWLPLLAIFWLGNIRDLLQDIRDYWPQDLIGKQSRRLCLADEGTGIYCGLPSYLQAARSILPEHSRIYLVADPLVLPYLAYRAIPYFQLEKDSSQADYSLFYYPPGIFFRAGRLYGNTPEQPGYLENYGLLRVIDQNKFIMKNNR